MYDSKLKLPQLSIKEEASLDQYTTMKKQVVQYISEGKTKDEAELLGGVRHDIIDAAYSTVRPWDLPLPKQRNETVITPGIPPLTERQQQVWDLTQRGMTQSEIAKELRCTQSTVAFTLKRVRLLKEKANEIMSHGVYIIYQTRIHLFVHGMELWEKVKRLCLGEDFSKDIDESISQGASEAISTHLSYSPYQLDKLVMDIVLATGGKCVIMADCFATNAIADVHTIYFIRDCIHTKDFPAGKDSTGRGLPVNCSICYLDDWIKCLGVVLSDNDEETVKKFNFWRGLFDSTPY